MNRLSNEPWNAGKLAAIYLIYDILPFSCPYFGPWKFRNGAFLNNYTAILHKYIRNMFDRLSAIFPKLTGRAKLRRVALHDGECSFSCHYSNQLKEMWHYKNQCPPAMVSPAMGHMRSKSAVVTVVFVNTIFLYQHLIPIHVLWP